ncbi:MAG: alginate export family protein [Cytophagales bacterium]|nr:alginate export family protein [Cytophagales bacterium]
MKPVKTLLPLVGILFFHHALFAQLIVGTQIRPRAEFRNGFKTLTEEGRDPAFFIEQRSRLFADYKAGPFQVKINFQDVRIWGSTSQIYKSDPTLTNIYEAWGLYHFNPKWSVKIGRMDLDYDNARFLGDLDWAAQGRSHDAFLISFKNDSSDLRLDVGGAFNQIGFEPTKLSETFYAGVNNYKTMQFAWLHKKFAGAKLSMLIHNDGRQVASDSSLAMRQTYGLIGSGKVAGLDVGGEFYFQGGKNGADTDVSAFLVSAYATIKTGITPLTLGFDYVSGTSVNDNKDKSFNPLYGTNHKFYGYMDYFYVGNAHGQQGNIAGLLDVHVKTRFKTGAKSSLVANTHIFNSAAELYNPTDADQSESKYLGTEVDLVFNMNPDKNVNFNLGYSQMFAGASMELVKATPGDHTSFNNWVWLMINFNPTIFTSDR